MDIEGVLEYILEHLLKKVRMERLLERVKSFFQMPFQQQCIVIFPSGLFGSKRKQNRKIRQLHQKG